jgi:hypothetical protein
MPNIRTFGLSILLVSLIGCQNNTEDIKNNSEVLTQSDTTTKGNNIATLMITNCYSCHATIETAENRIAPAMSEVKTKYLTIYKTKEEFVRVMSNYVNNPTLNNVIMPKAYDKFGIMPNMQFNKADVNEIVNYIYNTAIDTDQWNSNNKDKGTTVTREGDYISLGRQIVMSTKKTLGKNLKLTIKNKGTKEAVSFCNLNAIPILDSMAILHNAKINRVTDRVRNENNMANEIEKKIIYNYQTQIDNGEDMLPVLKENDEFATFYLPIVTNEMCMKCHSTPDQIDKETGKEINRLYPNDMAIGYAPQQIRGVWKVIMEK